MEARSRRVLLRSLGLGLAVIGFGTVGYMTIEDQSLLDAFYMTAITVTTVGFREAFPLSAEGKAFTIMLSFGGIRPGCWVNIIPANGLVLFPEASARLANVCRQS